MARYTYYNTATQTVIATGRPWPTKDGVSDPPELPADVVLLEEVTAARPAHDTATEKLVENAIAYDTVAKTATRSWSVVALTQAEIDERTPPHVVINGIKWKSDEVSQAAFSSMTLLIDKAGMADTDNVQIKDALGATHTMTVSEYMTSAVQYGLLCYQAFHSS